MNTGIVPFILSVVVFDDYHFGRITGSGGLIYNICFVIMGNSLLPAVISIFDIPKYIKNIY